MTPTEAQPPSPPTAVPGRTPGTPRRWRQLALLSGLMSVDGSESNAASVMFPALRTALGLPLGALGVLIAVSKLVGAALAPLWVLAAHRFPRKVVLAVSCGFWGVWTVGTGFAQSFGQLLVLFTVAAVGVAGGVPLVNGILADLFDDRTRGRAVGLLYGLAALGTGLTGPLLGRLASLEDGWRYGFFLLGSVQMVFGVLVLVFLRDPGIGASEPQPASREGAEKPRRADVRPLNRARARELMRNRTLMLVCLQRATTGQLVLLGFGVTFLVDARGFSNAEASVVTLPFAAGYLLGTLLGGLAADAVHRASPRAGRIMMMQTVTFVYAVFAYVCTQFVWSSLAMYIALFTLLAAIQGCSPGVTRPTVMAVVQPELRSAAFALMTAAEAVGWALTTLLFGFLGDSLGLEAAFLWLSVVLVLANGILVTPLYRTFPRDTAALHAGLNGRPPVPKES